MALPRLEFNVDDNKTLKFRWMQSDKVTPVDISGFTITFFARAKAGASAYTIDPVTATIPLGTDGRFEFDVDMPSSKTNSLYWIERTDGANVDTSPPAEGTQIQILAK